MRQFRAGHHKIVEETVAALLANNAGTPPAPPAPNFLLDSNGATVIGPAATISRTSTGTITRQTPTGRMQVQVQVTFVQTVGATGTITASIQRDGVSIGTPVDVGPVAGGASAPVTLTDVDGILDSLPHHYGWTATTTGGTISVSANRSSVIVIEDVT
jgi:hypothetical protein